MIEVHIVVIVVALIVTAASIALGILLERVRWNELIAEGKIPKPKNGRRGGHKSIN